MNIGCILLGAGSGKRFGGDKLLHCIDGVSMIERACKLHASLPYALRVLVTRPNDEAVADVGRRYGFTVAVNERASCGIGTSAGVGANALLCAESPLDGALFGVCDQPYLTADCVRLLFDAFTEAPDRIVAPVCCGKRGNPVLFPAALLHEFLTLSGDTGGSAIIGAHPELLTLVELPCAAALTDIDLRRNEPC